MTKLSGKVAIVDGGAVIDVRDLGPEEIDVKPGVLPLVEVFPDLADGESYGGADYTIEETRVVVTYDVVAAPVPEIPKSTIVTRLYQAGKLEAAQQALAANPYARERWYAADKPVVKKNDPDARALIQGIGLDPDDILAP